MVNDYENCQYENTVVGLLRSGLRSLPPKEGEEDLFLCGGETSDPHQIEQLNTYQQRTETGF